MPEPTPTVFPRASPSVTIPPDDTGYADRKTAAAAFQEYGGDYTARSGSTTVFGEKYWLDTINADAAYARGATGAGETIAVFDTGIRETHREFSGKNVDVETLPRDSKTPYTPTDAQKFHGTYVAGLAAANRGGSSGGNGLDMHGVAFDADLHFTQIELGNPAPAMGFRYSSLSTVEGDGDTALFFDILLGTAYGAGARIANLSFGIQGSISYFLAQYGETLLRERYRQTAGVLAQPDRSAADKMIIVWAAGNEATATLADGSSPDFSSPGVWDGLGLIFPELRGHIITVVALGQDGNIARYSNHCGIAKDFCLAAPGSNMVSASNFGDDLYSIGSSGTSFAAPIVSGSLALLRQYFRGQLGSTELVTRLLATANRGGRYANSDIYGHGLVDLDAATRPFGTVAVLGIPIAQNAIAPGAPFGDALSRAFNGQSIAAFDSLNAPFQYNLDGFVKAPTAASLAPLQQLHAALPAPRPAAGGVEGLLGSGDFAFATDGHRRVGQGLIAAGPASHLRLANGGFNLDLMNRNHLTLSAFTNETERPRTPKVAGFTVAWQPRGDARGNRFGNTQFGFGGGYVRESEQTLSTSGEGAFGDLSAQTVFVAAVGTREITKWKLTAGAELGAVFTDGGGVFDDVEPLITSAFSLSAERAFFERHKIRFGLSAPLRVEAGKANITLPAGRTQTGEVTHRKITPSLTPTGRQLDATATWQRKLPAGYLTLTSRLSHQPNHTADADVSIATLASYRFEF